MYLEACLEKRSKEYIKLYYNTFKDVLVCTSLSKKSFYIYNDNNKLWEYKQVRDI